MITEALLLCGGSSKRMKPFLPFNKILAEIKPGTTLIQHQVSWLRKNGVSSIVLAIDMDTYDLLIEEYPDLVDGVECSVESEKLGTGGAVRNALDRVMTPFFYVMNADDILVSSTYSPHVLGKTVENRQSPVGAILLTRTVFPFGVVLTDGGKVKGFQEKPRLDLRVSAGHYALTKDAVEEYFPERGNLEDTAFPMMARDGVLFSMVYDDEWITVNNMKQLETAKRRMSNSAEP